MKNWFQQNERPFLNKELLTYLLTYIIKYMKASSGRRSSSVGC